MRIILEHKSEMKIKIFLRIGNLRNQGLDQVKGQSSE